jgi:hypothetical protein
MATATLTHERCAFTRITHRPQRVFQCHYFCDECPNEFSDELLVAGPSWCPACDKPCEPYSVVEFEESRPEFEEEEV